MTRKLWQPIEINGMQIKNRIGFAPMLNNPVGEDGSVTEKTLKWYEERARGGVGLIMTGTVCPSRGEWERRRDGLALYNDTYIEGYTRLADVVHSYGAKLGLQIGVLGPLVGIGPSPSPYPDKIHAKVSTVPAREVEEISIEHIKRIVKDFGAE